MLKIAFHPNYILNLPPGHRFPMEKYDLLPRQLMYEGTVDQSNFFAPNIPELDLVLNVHNPVYVNRLVNLELSPREQRKTGFPHSKELVNRELQIMEGTRKCADFALDYGIALNIAGGTHHAYSDRGEGFCMLNDQAVAAQWLLDNNKAKKVLIIDLDVHQGNGTAEIFNNNPNVFTFSMHGKNNYPLHKEKSDLDIELEDGIDDLTYLNILNNNLSRVFDDFQPDFLFFQSGVDVLKTDKLGRLGLTLNGVKDRDRLVLNLAKKNNLPIVCSMGGGYSPDIKDIIEAHANTFRLAQEIFF